MKNTAKTTNKTETKAEKPIKEKPTFQTLLKEAAKESFILYLDSKKEIAIYKEKIVDLSSPKNVLHCIDGTKIHADYVTAAKAIYSMEELYKTMRTGKGTYKINPIIAGLLYHFCERIEKKILLLKDYKDTKIVSKAQAIKESCSCDIKNMNKFICKDLDDMISKDYPNRMGDIDKEYLSCSDPSTGIITFNCK